MPVSVCLSVIPVPNVRSTQDSSSRAVFLFELVLIQMSRLLDPVWWFSSGAVSCLRHQHRFGYQQSQLFGLV